MSRFHGCGQTYFQAAATCKNRGGHLFLPRSEDETQKVKEDLLNQSLYFKKWSSSRSGHGSQLHKTLDRRQTGKSHLSAWMVGWSQLITLSYQLQKSSFPQHFFFSKVVSCSKFSGGRTGVEIILPGPISRWGDDFKDYFMYFSSPSQIQIFKIPQKTRWVKNLSSN